MQGVVTVQAWLVVIMACFATLVIAAPAKKAEDAISIVGTWSSGSQQVSTGRVGNEMFYNPYMKQFLAPRSGGISYSFTDDGFFEVAKFQYNSNCKAIFSDNLAEKPGCFTAQLIWQHGTYVSNQSTITMNPYKGDGAVQTLNPCQSKDKQVQMSVYADAHGMSRPVQRLILEVLRSRPPLRDVRAYLNLFGGRGQKFGSDFFSKDKVHSPPETFQSSRPSEPSLSELSSADNPSAEANAHTIPLNHDATIVADRVSGNEEVDSLAGSHTALVKLQGPFTDRQLLSIAEGLEYLKRLGLICVVVLDNDNWNPLTKFDSNARLIPPQHFDMKSWPALQDIDPHDPTAPYGRLELGQRYSIERDLWRIADLFTSSGLDACPFGHALMRVAPKSDVAPSEEHHTELTSERAPLVADDGLQSMFRAIEVGQTPILAPLVLYDDQSLNESNATGALRTLCIDADEIMVALAREMTQAHTRQCTFDPDRYFDVSPVRLMVINREGGIPSHARGGNPHLSINLKSEYDAIRSSFVWNDTHPTALSNLDMIRDCLAYMPLTSSGVMVTHRSPRSLIANLITNKAAHSPSLPHRLLARRQDVRHTPTVIRSGLPVRVLSEWKHVDQDKLHTLLEKSFKRNLNRDEYYRRLEQAMDFLIVIGDYDGVAIVTNEFAPDDPENATPIAYLNKFAVLPKLQGSGAVDFLWGALRDEVHGLGLLDALNNNGGRNGFGLGRDLVWKSRTNNPVNRWYFERSNGFIRLPASFGVAPDQLKHTLSAESAWTMFWCDAEQRLAELAGLRILTSSSSMEEIRDSVSAQRSDIWTSVTSGRPIKETILPIIAQEERGRLKRWERCLATIPSAWL
ncbi:amino-acid N-acetyltransferase [Malassezia yamatoensis]|uniref:Amino-acid acetyltransferase, mitochondrial n=1 Tax=Malassezia yamatoensis TaxID=253288 RepID=A0AAJ6CII3_9BASI|nr:amino-acid N-acetyltransferase [Malassezia yamatoensis]